MDVRLIWTDYDEAGDYVVPNVLSPRELVSRPNNMDETVPHHQQKTTLSVLLTKMILEPCMILSIKSCHKSLQFPTRSDIKRAVQTQKMAKDLKFWI